MHTTIQHLNPDGTITREWMIGSPDPQAVQTVTVERVKQGPSHFAERRYATWLYEYTPDNGLRRTYGTGLADTRAYLRRVFPNATIVETWR